MCLLDIQCATVSWQLAQTNLTEDIIANVFALKYLKAFVKYVAELCTYIIQYDSKKSLNPEKSVILLTVTLRFIRSPVSITCSIESEFRRKSASETECNVNKTLQH